MLLLSGMKQSSKACPDFCLRAHSETGKKHLAP